MEYPRISVFGLGYVGSVTAACLAERGCEVIGCDVAKTKVDLINAGKAPIGEPGLDALLSEQRDKGRVRATLDTTQAVLESDISIVCVGTPSTPSGALDLQYVEGVAHEIAGVIAKKEGSHTVIFRSTMLPGSTRRIAETVFAEIRDRVEVYFFPEFLRQGSALADFRDPSLSAIGLLEEHGSIDPIASLLEPGTEVMPAESAELLKYGCNAFHATKVAFANEMGRIGKSLGIDSVQVMNTLCQDDRLNISSYYMRPGTPFGGSCLPKDVSALSQHARTLGIAVPLLDSLMDSNQRHLESLLARVEASQNRKVLLLGVAFKAGTDDLRGSAILELALSLLLRGYEVQILDPDVAPQNLIGANKRFVNYKLASLESFLIPDIASAFEAGQPLTAVVSKPCVDPDEFAKFANTTGSHVIDVNGWNELAGVANSYEGLCW